MSMAVRSSSAAGDGSRISLRRREGEVLERHGRRRLRPLVSVTLALAAAAVASAAHAATAEGREPDWADDEKSNSPLVHPPWYFDCSNNPEWRDFRLRFGEFRRRFATEDKDSPDLLDFVSEVMMEANHLGQKYEATFVKWASSWDIFHLCNESAAASLDEELLEHFCFYGFVVVQWFGIFGSKHFRNVPGMAEWAHNALGFLNDASKFNAMHFLESSGWAVKLEELAQTLSMSYQGEYKAARDVPELRGFASFDQPMTRSPQHTQVMRPLPLKAVGISYHASLLREPLTTWSRVLGHRFEIEAAVHILVADDKPGEVLRRKSSHCQYIEGAWCASDERLLELNNFFEVELLSGRSGDHKTRHHFITDTAAYHRRFLELFGNDPGMRSADVFMCGEPVFFCQLLSDFGKPVVGYISTPLSVYVRKEDRASWYQSFYEMATDPRHFFVTTTPIFSEWNAYATGVDLPVVRPVCFYTDAEYWPVRNREVLLLRAVSLFWDSECVLNHFSVETQRARAAAAVAAAQAMADGSSEAAASLAAEFGTGGGLGEGAGARDPLRFVESTSLTAQERIGYAAFGEFRAAVIYPYAVSQMWFYEFYSMGVPIYMPSRETLPLFVNGDYSLNPDFEGHRPGHVPLLVHPFSPFDVDDWNAMTYWMSFTDFMLMPHISHFESMPQLMLLLENQDHRAISRDMRRFHAEQVGLVTTFWASVLDAVAGSKGATAEPAEATWPLGFRERWGKPDLHSDEARDLSTRQPSGGSLARPDGSHRKANDGDTSQQHPSEYHFDAVRAPDTSYSYWWVHLRRATSDPEVKIWPRDCCSESFGHRLWLLIGNSTDREHAEECASVDVVSGEQLSTICRGSGSHIFVEARSLGGWGYDRPGEATLMLPEVRVLRRD